MPGDNVKSSSKVKVGRSLRSVDDPILTPMARFDSDCDVLPPQIRKRLNELFGQIEKEFEILYTENVTLQDRVDLLTERLESVNADKLAVENQDAPDIGSKPPKRSASQISQKIKTTYKASTSKIVSSFRNPSPVFSLVRNFPGHRDGVWEVSISKSGQSVLGTASADHTARIWCIQNEQCLLQYQGHQGSVNSIRFHPDKELVLTASGDNTAHIWGAHINIPLDALKKSGVSVLQKSQSSGEDDIEGSEKEDLADDAMDPVMEAASLRTPSMELTGHGGVVIAADWMSEGGQVITASWDRTAILYDAESGDQISTLTGHDQELTDVRAHPVQRLAVTSSKDTTFRLWDFRGPSMLVFQGHTQPVTSAVFSGAENIVSGSDDRSVKVWDLRNMRSPIASIRTDASVNRLSVSQNQHLIAIPHDNRHIRIYDIIGNRLGRLPRSNRQGHGKMVCSVAWAEDNQLCNLFSCGFDRQVLGWNIDLPNKEQN